MTAVDAAAVRLGRLLLPLAVEVAHAAARLVRERRESGFALLATKSSVTDVVTEVDRASETLIKQLVADARPDDGFLGEEGSVSAGRSGVRWVVDPIDGTVNFVSGFPEYAVSIGAELDGEAIAGAVVHVPTGTAFAASLGCGAHRDGRPIRVRSGQPLAESLIATGFNYRRDVRTVQAGAAARLLPHIGDIRRTGSCAMDLAHVAEGSLGGYLEEGVHPWDHSAGGLIAREAGARTGQTTGAGGLDLFLCAPAERFEELWELAEECGFFA